MGLTLLDVVNAAQDGMDWKSRRDQDQVRIAEEAKRRQTINDANAAGAKVISEAEQKWRALQPGEQTRLASPIGSHDVAPPAAAPSAPRGEFLPDHATIARALDARGAALAKAGDLHAWTENEVQASHLRSRVRSQVIGQALQRFQTDQDPISLAQSVYPTIADGREITMAKRIAGPDGKQAIEFSFSDGKKGTLTPEQIVNNAKDALMNPDKVAEYEFQTRLAQAKATADATAKSLVERIKGEEERKTEGVKTTGRLSLADSEHGYKVGEIGLENAGRVKVAGIHAGATVQAAQIGADGRLALAEAKADAAANKPPKTLDADNLHNLVLNATPEVRGITDPISGKYAGTQQSLAITERAQQWMKSNPGMPETEAIRRASSEWKQRQPAPK